MAAALCCTVVLMADKRWVCASERLTVIHRMLWSLAWYVEIESGRHHCGGFNHGCWGYTIVISKAAL